MFRTQKINFNSKIITGIVALLLVSCQKDDICPAGSETTPLLVIEFVDAADPTRLKAVQNLVVQADGEELFLGPKTTNSIAIPLRTDESVTQYSFTARSGSEAENTDIISFRYDPAPQYLNRACGFKVNFTNIEANTLPDTDNWIQSEFILQEDVANETATHISISH